MIQERDPSKNLDDLLDRSGEWMRGEGPCQHIVISSRARLARNLSGFHFMTKMTGGERGELAARVRDALRATPSGGDLIWYDLETMSDLDLRFLVERHLISREQEETDGARAVAVDAGEKLAVMVNEEDHLRLQSLRCGFQLDEAYAALETFDDELSRTLEYAFDEEFGYLTACPTNVGTGLRVSVMMHLPALVMTRHIEKAFRAIHDLRLAVRGLYGEGTEAHGELYQISNQITTGRSEHELIDDLRVTIDAIVQYETRAREKLIENEKNRVEDRVWRAYATLRSARLINSEEAMKLLSSVRLGVHLGILPQLQYPLLNTIFATLQPAHLQRIAGRELPPEERDVVRARDIRERLAEAEASAS